MRPTLLAAAALVLALPAAAAAQLANRAISLESGLSTPVAARGQPAAAVALAASWWLDDCDAGDLLGVLRVAFASAPETSGRAAVGVAATAGLRLSLGRAAVRPQLFADVGWIRPRAGAPSDRLGVGVGAGLEWFPVPDLSVSARAALRGAGRALGAETVLGVAAYF